MSRNFAGNSYYINFPYSHVRYGTWLSHGVRKLLSTGVGSCHILDQSEIILHGAGALCPLKSCVWWILSSSGFSLRSASWMLLTVSDHFWGLAHTCLAACDGCGEGKATPKYSRRGHWFELTTREDVEADPQLRSKGHCVLNMFGAFLCCKCLPRGS